MKCKIKEESLGCNQAAIDRSFIAAGIAKDPRLAEKKQEIGIGNALMRYEFLEVIVRLAKIRFFDSRVCETYHESLSMLINDYLEKY